MNRIIELFSTKKEGVLNVYYTAGYPALNDTLPVLKALQQAGADMVEIGMPYSDPVADGPTIQQSNDVALQNGMTVKLLFDQLTAMRKDVQIPVLLMGYLNPVIQFGIEKFCARCKEIGVDGVILPDMPMQVYLDEYKAIFDSYGLLNTFLITPQTSEERIRQIDAQSEGFIYMVSSASVTGSTKGIQQEQENYFRRVKDMNLQNPTMIGFGISDHASFEKACQYANGAIIGSAFIKVLQQSTELQKDIIRFVRDIKLTAVEG
ncbi:tryptophan synthase subunit alpha [Rhodocytophaga aerolata]|uniref:Tryptophan synthase alpha chain n=1 Tax=Rhodocytophaga aerolata TaxID=455078 RepID=A0ABT8R6D3_9BACT|nr:tryptophan synthase subunit alpha [Rhodocytophaga aerolata]MDO1447659.1 tryptophan synthase subunit alpha [Rhodocytophaga aerolata]